MGQRAPATRVAVGRNLSLLPLLGVWIAVALVCLGLGAVHIPVGDILRMVLSKGPFEWMQTTPDWPAAYEVILFRIRLPRVLLAGLVGASLALAGTILQGLFRNPMAGPYVLGTSSGASLGAVLAMVWPASLGLLGANALPILAFFGALATTWLVYGIARVKGHVPVATLLLAGIAVSSFLSAVVSLILVFSERSVSHVIFWLMGGLSRADWSGITLVLPYFLIGTAVTLFYARRLNAMLLGEEAAQHLGIDVERMKQVLIVATALLVAAAVSVSGVIGFVGLIVPHVVRLIVGPNHRILVPTAAIVGAIFLTGADTLARTALGSTEIPVGAITALVGGPFFLFLLRRRRVALL